MQFDPKDFDHLTACPDCDLLLQKTEAPTGHSILCPRCGKTISRRNTDSIRKALALSIAGLFMYLPAMLLPLMTMESFGFSDSANIIDSLFDFYNNGYYLVSFMVLLSAVIFPLMLLSSVFIISLQLYRQKYPWYLARLFRGYLHLEEWAMVEVYLLGIMVTVIKMGSSADISYNTGIFCFTGLVMLTIALAATIDRDLFWQTIEDKGKKNNTPLAAQAPVPVQAGDDEVVTAAMQGLSQCHICHKLSLTNHGAKRCPRCGEPLHLRHPSSISKTWALVLTSAIFLAPANLLPIMRVDFLGVPSRSTIMDGIIYFFQHGSYFIGLIIFTASVLVPVFKIVGLTILLLSTRPCGIRLLRQRAKMFRFITFIGRWSMLDIFVIALLSVLVNFGFFTSIHAAPAATYFCIVVASTMFAVITFDPRLIWDRCSQPQQAGSKNSRINSGSNP